MNKKILIPLVLAILAAGGIFVFKSVLNKEHRDISAAQADFKISSSDLKNEFVKDSKTAIIKYTEKVVEVSGTIEKIIPNDSLSKVVLTTGGSYTITVEALGSENEKVKGLKAGSNISLKGLFIGFLAEDKDFGEPGDIQFRKGSILK